MAERLAPEVGTRLGRRSSLRDRATTVRHNRVILPHQSQEPPHTSRCSELLWLSALNSGCRLQSDNPIRSRRASVGGYDFPNAIISPRECYRKLDAVWFDSGDPLHPRFKMFSDWPRCLPNLRGPGSWELEYEVISENVPGSRIMLSMDVHHNGEVCLHPI
jgi:hypothetical protein